MDKTLNQIKKELNEIATAHNQIESFFFGDFVDAVTRDYIKYRLLCCTVQPGEIGDNYLDVNLNLVVCDKYNEGNFRQIDEVHSDCLTILRDIFVTFKQHRFEQYLDINGSASVDPFINRGQDVTAGWSMNLSLRIYDDSNWCELPMTGFDFGND